MHWLREPRMFSTVCIISDTFEWLLYCTRRGIFCFEETGHPEIRFEDVLPVTELELDLFLKTASRFVTRTAEKTRVRFLKFGTL